MTSETALPHSSRKPKTVAIDPRLHRYLKMLSALLDKGINELIEPGAWGLVRDNQTRLEAALGETIVLPDPNQSELALEEAGA